MIPFEFRLGSTWVANGRAPSLPNEGEVVVLRNYRFVVLTRTWQFDDDSVLVVLNLQTEGQVLARKEKL